jgi:hypothetical protein
MTGHKWLANLCQGQTSALRIMLHRVHAVVGNMALSSEYSRGGTLMPGVYADQIGTTCVCADPAIILFIQVRPNGLSSSQWTIQGPQRAVVQDGGTRPKVQS